MKKQPNKLAVLWTAADRDTAQKMVFMYSFNAKKNGWFDEVKLIIWGPTAKLISEDKELQDYLAEMIKVGVEVIACKACADMYGVSDKLTQLGANVFLVGEEFTQILKTDWKLLSV